MLAARMKELREALGLSMPSFGRRLGCSRDVIANLEYGRVEPKEVFLDHVCEVYNVNPQWLYHGDGEIFSGGADENGTGEAMEIFRSLSPDLRELALSQLKSLQNLMNKRSVDQPETGADNVDTIRLMAAMLSAQDFGSLENHTVQKFQVQEQLRQLMRNRELSVSALANASLVNENELTKILDSEGTLRRDAAVSICLALSLDAEATQRMLTSAGLPSLYAKNRRDAACLFAIVKGLNVPELNTLLEELGEPQM